MEIIYVCGFCVLFIRHPKPTNQPKQNTHKKEKKNTLPEKPLESFPNSSYSFAHVGKLLVCSLRGVHPKTAVRVEEDIVLSEDINAGIHSALDFLDGLHLLVGAFHTAAANLLAFEVVL